MDTIKLRRGDTFSYGAQVKVGASPQDLTGWQIAADARRVNGDTVQAITAAVVDAGQGLASLTIAEAGTAAMAAGYWHLQIRLTTPAGVSSSSEPAIIAVRA